MFFVYRVSDRAGSFAFVREEPIAVMDESRPLVGVALLGLFEDHFEAQDFVDAISVPAEPPRIRPLRLEWTRLPFP